MDFFTRVESLRERWNVLEHSFYRRWSEGSLDRTELSFYAGEYRHAVIALADALDAAALIVPSATGGAPRACAKYRRRRPIIALAHQPGVANQLTLEWVVYPASMPTSHSVDEMIDQALVAARDYAGLEMGARVVLTAGRRTGTPGATNLVMVREIP